MWILAGSNNRVGGSAPGQRNLISGNLVSGIRIGRPEGQPFATREEDPGTEMCVGTIIEGNWIGLDHSGLRAIPNGRHWNSDNHALNISRFATGTIIGGRNVISGNEGVGILVDAAAATTHAIRGNNIGASADGSSALPNTGAGVVIVGEPVVAVGGTAPGEGNRIAHNGGPGIDLSRLNANVAGLPLHGNLIHHNHSRGGILLSASRTPNDPDDADNGPNGRQNWPLLLAAYNRNGVTEVAADLSSFAANVPVRVDILRAAGGGGDLVLATTVVTTGSDSNDRYLIPAQLQSVGMEITALATTADGTSEFSPPLPVVEGLDSDGDGIPDALELEVPIVTAPRGLFALSQNGGVPVLGDRNADGVSDSTQANVASARVPGTEIWITVAVASGRALTDVVALRSRDVLALTGTNEGWPGAVRFTLAGGTGAAEPVQLWFPVGAPTSTAWVATESGWRELSDASNQTRGSLNLVGFSLPAGVPGTGWMIALGRPRASIESPQLTVLPLEWRILERGLTDAVPAFSVDGTGPSPIPQGWVVPVRIALPDGAEDLRLETSINLADWEVVTFWPGTLAAEIELAWSIGDGSRFFRWRRAY